MVISLGSTKINRVNLKIRIQEVSNDFKRMIFTLILINLIYNKLDFLKDLRIWYSLKLYKFFYMFSLL